MKCAAFTLIIGLNILLIIVWFACGAALLANTYTCRDRSYTYVHNGIPILIGPCD
eukprot:CAMPEP_0174745326 /NCGR_PEP_ID=MMETSP1094-20130205/86546_1 /TAXON_ID=156173 /ORGANISM="Chrysochromulina brevifilum, Strain UTEX LB 985" /LENGTH=54 /DNA_ID=CAMNT_0015949861 /DNA_START=201 /DNA_END=362 /DNA_ORIENTATION=+